MKWYDEHVLPKLLDVAMDTAQHRRIRARVSAGLAGTVVELGFGSGHNLTHLPSAVTRLLAVEPSRSSLLRAQARIAGCAVPVQVVRADAQQLPLPDASVDAALCTWSLCSIADPMLPFVRCRVLCPSGRLHFVEHGAAPDTDVRRWQARLNPLQQRLVGGCTLDLDVPALLRACGMSLTHLETYYATGQPKTLAAIYEGTAVAA